MGRTRFNIYRYAHKSLRLLLAELIERAGRTDFRDQAELGRLREDTELTLRLVRAHSRHEATFLGPLLQLYCPELGSKVADDHTQHEALLDGLWMLLVSTDPNRPDAALRGQDFNLRLARCAGELLIHMSEEEQLVLPALWQKVSDKTLQTVSESLLANMAQGDQVVWLQSMLRALNRRERVSLLARMRATLPPATFDATVDSVRAELKSVHGSVISDLRLLESAAA
ncbi:MAG TPA: hemerythrin domain-containing protein [Polyangiales bacterium]